MKRSLPRPHQHWEGSRYRFFDLRESKISLDADSCTKDAGSKIREPFTSIWGGFIDQHFLYLGQPYHVRHSAGTRFTPLVCWKSVCLRNILQISVVHYRKDGIAILPHPTWTLSVRLLLNAFVSLYRETPDSFFRRREGAKSNGRRTVILCSRGVLHFFSLRARLIELMGGCANRPK